MGYCSAGKLRRAELMREYHFVKLGMFALVKEQSKLEIDPRDKHTAIRALNNEWFDHRIEGIGSSTTHIMRCNADTRIQDYPYI